VNGTRTETTGQARGMGTGARTKRGPLGQPHGGIPLAAAAELTGMTMAQLRHRVRTNRIRFAKVGRYVVLHPVDVTQLAAGFWQGTPVAEAAPLRTSRQQELWPGERSGELPPETPPKPVMACTGKVYWLGKELAELHEAMRPIMPPAEPADPA